MNEIKETLLMIFLEKKEKLYLYEKLFNGGDLTVYECDCLNREVDLWNEFKQEELGRTIPDEFEFYISDIGIDNLRAGFHQLYTQLSAKRLKTKSKSRWWENEPRI